MMEKTAKLIFVLYSRSYCHLCEDMLNELMLLKPVHAFDIDIFDVDADDMLLAQYDEMVPVLLVKNGETEPVYLCHYHFDKAKVLSYLSGAN